MSIFGFSTTPSAGGDWLPIVQYDARAGRMFRSDRGQDTAGEWTTVKEDITGNFKALCDFENVEVGWLAFPPNAAPSFVLVPMGSKLPDQPSELHKNGIRFVLKLAKDCGGDRPIREIASSARVFLAGIEQVYHQYLADKDKNPGKLPVLMLEKTSPVTTGSGTRSSTNYQPTFKIVGWALRGDLKPQPRATALPQSNLPLGNNGSAPATGGQRAQPPQQQAVAVDDFG